MAAYRRRIVTATKKRNAARKKEPKTKKGTRTKKVTSKARARAKAPKALKRKKKVAAKQSAKTRSIRKRTKPVVRAKVRAKRTTKKIVAKPIRRRKAPKKRRAKPKPKAKAKPKSKRRVARRRGLPTAIQIRRKNLARSARERTLQAPKNSPERLQLRREKQALEVERVDWGLRRRKLPDTEGSRVSNWERLQNRWDELFAHARKTGQLPPKASRQKEIDSPERIGEQRTIHVNQLVEPDVVEEILYRFDQVVQTMTKAFRIWYADLVVSGLGEKFFGSNTPTLDLAGDADALFFQTYGYDNTGIFNSSEGLRNRLKEMLEEIAGTPRSIAYLHYIQVKNFSSRPQPS